MWVGDQVGKTMCSAGLPAAVGQAALTKPAAAAQPTQYKPQDPSQPTSRTCPVLRQPFKAPNKYQQLPRLSPLLADCTVAMSVFMGLGSLSPSLPCTHLGVLNQLPLAGRQHPLCQLAARGKLGLQPPPHGIHITC